MQYSVVIPTYRTDNTIHQTLSSLAKQTLKPEVVVIVIDINFKDRQVCDAYKQWLSEFEEKLPLNFVTQFSHDFIPWQDNASYVRNYWYKQTRSDFILSIDDDNIFNESFVEKCIKHYQIINEFDNKEMMLVPTEKWRDTHVIRSQWYKKFNPRIGWVAPYLLPPRIPYQQISFASTNCLFGPRKLFELFPFDESLPFVYEDFDMTYRLSKAWYLLYVLADTTIHHMIRDKTVLEDSYIDTMAHAYQKGKNRVLWVKKNMSFLQQLIYYCLWLWIHSLALSYKIIRYSKNIKQCASLLRALSKWTWKGMMTMV